MTRYVIATLFLVLSAAASAECTLRDFTVIDFNVAVKDCRGPRCPKLELVGKLVNNCSQPAAAQVEIEARTDYGSVVDTVEGWPAMTANLAPGEARPFDFGPLLKYNRKMVDFSVAITDVKTW